MEIEKEMFVVELPLKVEKWQSDVLNKRYELLAKIYNYAQEKLLRQYIYLTQMDEYKKCKTKKDKSVFFKNRPFYFKGITSKITFSEYDVTAFFEKIIKKNVSSDKTYKDFGINTSITGYLGKHAWSAWEKKIYGTGKKISFKNKGELSTISIRKKSEYFGGLDVDIEHMILSFNINGKTKSKAKKIILPINTKNLTEYEMYALKGGYDSIKVVTIARKMIRGKYKYYVQFTIEGEKPQKGRTLGKGNVGIDIGPSTVAISSLNGVTIDTLAEKCDNIEDKISDIERKLDRSRRATNPQNFTEDGQIKRIDRKKGEKREWEYSKRYVKLNNKKRELLRKQSAIRKLQHNIKANEVLSLGDTFIVENNPTSAWAKRAKGVRKNKNGKIQTNKRFGKSIGNHAPAMFVTILQNKVESLKGKFVKVDIKNAASRFDFTNGGFTEHNLDERKITLSNGNTHQRDMLAAFNLQHIDLTNDDLKKYNVDEMIEDYPIFCKLEKEEIKRFTNGMKISKKSNIGI